MTRYAMWLVLIVVSPLTVLAVAPATTCTAGRVLEIAPGVRAPLERGKTAASTSLGTDEVKNHEPRFPLSYLLTLQVGDSTYTVEAVNVAIPDAWTRVPRERLTVCTTEGQLVIRRRDGSELRAAIVRENTDAAY